MLPVVTGSDGSLHVQHGPSNATSAVLAFAGAVRPRPSLAWKEVPPVWVSSCSQSCLLQRGRGFSGVLRAGRFWRTAGSKEQAVGCLPALLPRISVRACRRNGSASTDPVPAASPLSTVDLITSSPQCLHSLVTWAHAHAGGCQSVPSLQSVLSSEYCGIIRAVWGCGDGHDYIMDTDSDCSTVLVDNALAVKREWNKNVAQRLTDNGADNAEAVSAPKAQHAPVRTTPCQQPANKGTTSVPLKLENEPAQDRDSSHSQLDSTALLQEKALPQPVSPLSSATGKGFPF